MKIAVMQPYFLPYIGYWQLICAVDIFVILDDVNFITRGYINRNSILLNNKAHRFSLPLDRPSQNRLIKDITLHYSPSEREKFLRTIQSAYRRAPLFEQVYPLIEDIIMNGRHKITEYIEYSFNKICEFSGIKTRFVYSSDIDKKENARGRERILEICRALNADTYINSPGGKNLYDAAAFRDNGLTLRFVQPNPSEYRQFDAAFVPNLSFLDVMMFNDAENLDRLLKEYTLDEPY